jgi:signal transduction histidine kinase
MNVQQALLRRVLPALLAGAAIGVLVFLLRMTQSVNGELHLQRLANLRTLNNLDVELNRSITQARAASGASGEDARSAITSQLGEALDKIDKGPESLHSLSPDLDSALEKFQNTIDDKFALGYDFEMRSGLASQRLINNLDAVPLRTDDVRAAAAATLKERVQELLTKVKAEIVTLEVMPTPTNAPTIRALLEDLGAVAADQPEALRVAVERLRGGAEEIIADKLELSEKRNAFLDRPTAQQLQAVEQAYIAWHESQVAVANQYRLYLVGYAALLLLVLAGLGLRLVRSFRELDRSHEELADANEHLEEQVETRTKDLSTALRDLQASQAQLVQSEKMASLGQMVAGVAHEINTPLGYARSNAEIVRTSLVDIRQLCAAQSKALTLMTAADASDEDVAQALATAQALGESVNAEELAGDLDNLLADADHGMVQISELVSSLKDFSRVDRSRNDLFNVNDGIESALKICNNQLKHKVEVVKSFGQLPPIECSPSQLNQVFLNLFTNAAQAIGDKGKIFIRTAKEAHGVGIRILDNGSGMSEAVRARIFEPFFTTKPVGKGTGLGLSIVYTIIQDHGGKIDVRSTPGKGTEFYIVLPFKQSRAAEAAFESQAMPELAAA